MATRQRTRSPRKTSSMSPAATSGSSDSSGTETRVQESEVLRAAFDPSSFDTSEAADTSRDTASEVSADDVPKAHFVGEQLIYKDRYERIAEAAYLRAEQRGFQPGNELEDWLAAEREVDALLSSDR